MRLPAAGRPNYLREDHQFLLLLRFERTKRHLSQSAIAQLSNIPQPTISHIEIGRLKPTVGERQRLAAVFGVSPEDLLRDIDVWGRRAADRHAPS